MALIAPTIKSDYQLEGPLAGFYAAQQMEDWKGAQDRSFRDDDTVNAINEHNLSEAQLDSPVKAMKRELEMLAGQEQKQAWDSGQMAQLKAVEREQQMKEKITKMNDDEVKQMSNRGDMAQMAMQELGEPGKTDPASIAAKWEVIRKSFKAVGKDIGDYSPEAHNKLASAAKMSLYTSKFIQQRSLEQEKIAADKAKQDSVNATHITTANIAANASRANAATGAAATREATADYRRTMNPGQYAIADLNAKVEKGQPLDENDLNKALSAFKLMNPNENVDLTKIAGPLATQMNANDAGAKAKKKQYGLPETMDNGQAAMLIAEIEQAQKDTRNIQTLIPGAKVKVDDKVKDVKDITYKDVPKYQDLPKAKAATVEESRQQTPGQKDPGKIAPVPGASLMVDKNGNKAWVKDGKVVGVPQ